MPMHFIFIFLLSLMLVACTGIPAGVKPVEAFDINRYLGTWYEIARLDHSFERGLDNVTATYDLQNDGSIRVINKGLSISDNGPRSATGKAYFVDDNQQGHLKVSFFGPFYSSYIIFGLDRDHYQYAFVSGYNTSYLWLLSRKPTIDPIVLQQFKDSARQLGFALDKLIMVRHD